VEPYGYLELLPCVDSSPQQKFAYSPDGAINYLASPPARVTVSDAQEKPGGYIFRSSNDASSDASNDAPAPYYQQFYFSGTVRAYDAPSVGGDEGGTPATQCLRTDPKGIFDKDHLTTIGFVDCDDADANQRWDYYFQ
jgi:hypothetical protein